MPSKLLTKTVPRSSLAERLTPELLERRRQLEGHPQRLGDGRKWFPLQMLEPLMNVARGALVLTGLYDRLARRAVRVDVVEHEFWVPRLPSALEGLRVLHLTDLHIDALPGLGRRLADLCSALDFDLAVITGDLRLDTKGPSAACLTEMAPLVPVLSVGLGAFAVLGNHDSVEIVEPLERLGVRYLLNESTSVARDGSELFIAGVDDAHFYGTDDIERALAAVDLAAPSLFLCHSPDIIPEAAERYVDLYLCGHTHGGQLCLPGGRPLVSNASCARRFTSGAWRYGALQGYTSRGVGFSGVPWRSFCPAEIVIHVLRRERRNVRRVAEQQRGTRRLDV